MSDAWSPEWEIEKRNMRIAQLEFEVSRLQKQLEYAETTPASAVAPEIVVTRENNEALGLKVVELEAQVAVLVEALEQVRETAEHSRRAESKGSSPYSLTFFLACLDKMDAALADTTQAAAAFVERIRAEESEKGLTHAALKAFARPDPEADARIEALVAAQPKNETRRRVLDEAAIRAEEREACAKVAETPMGSGAAYEESVQPLLDEVAAAIRARSKDNQTGRE